MFREHAPHITKPLYNSDYLLNHIIHLSLCCKAAQTKAKGGVSHVLSGTFSNISSQKCIQNKLTNLTLEGRMRALVTQMYMHCQTTARCPTTTVSKRDALANYDIHLQRHQKTFSLDVGKTKVYTTRITIDIPIADDVFHLRINSTDEAIGKLFYASMISL